MEFFHRDYLVFFHCFRSYNHLSFLLAMTLVCCQKIFELVLSFIEVASSGLSQVCTKQLYKLKFFAETFFLRGNETMQPFFRNFDHVSFYEWLIMEIELMIIMHLFTRRYKVQIFKNVIFGLDIRKPNILTSYIDFRYHAY